MSSRARRHVLVGAAAGVVLAVSFAAAGAIAAGDATDRIQVHSVDASGYPEVRVVASVLGAGGQPVGGLGADDLRVTEDGKPVSARVDLASATAPVALAFVIDASGSMAGEPLRDAVASTVAMVERLGPHDQAALITFRETVDVIQPLTSDKAALAAAAAKMLFPMVGLIFPALFVVILGPAVPRVLALFHQVGGP